MKSLEDVAKELAEAGREALKGGDGHDGDCTNDEYQDRPCWKHIDLSDERDARLRRAIEEYDKFLVR